MYPGSYVVLCNRQQSSLGFYSRAGFYRWNTVLNEKTKRDINKIVCFIPLPFTRVFCAFRCSMTNSNTRNTFLWRKSCLYCLWFWFPFCCWTCWLQWWVTLTSSSFWNRKRNGRHWWVPSFHCNPNETIHVALSCLLQRRSGVPGALWYIP